MYADFTFKPLARLKIGEHLIQRGVKELDEKIKINGKSSGVHNFKNQLEALRERLRTRKKRNQSFEEASAVVGRERLLLQLYIDPPSEESWLPPFDIKIAESILGNDGSMWPSFRRGLAAQLFFTRFSQLPAMNVLAAKLQESYSREDTCNSPIDRTWHKFASQLFASDGPERIAASALDGESLAELIERLQLSSKSIKNQQADYLKCLKDVYLVSRLQRVPLGQGENVLKEFQQIKKDPYQGGVAMGAKALQIILGRVQNESEGKWPGIWSQWIVSLGCDPRFGRDNADVAKWWGWASQKELILAQQGITGLTLKFFIEFLERSLDGTLKAEQFEARRDFLLQLFDARIINSARLVLNRTPLRGLDEKHRNIWSVARLDKTTDDTSMICLECIDDIYIIEGTHSFGLRAFRKRFPISDFWIHPRNIYEDKQLRISESKCDRYLRHDPHGKWREHFRSWIRSLHLEWNI
jgi:hypothetical protein